MPSPEYSAEDRHRLLTIARGSMIHGVETGAPLAIDTASVSEPLTRIRSSFVTLHLASELRGCMGSLEATQALARDVADSACRTALSDPRFLPVQPREVREIEIEISVLSPMQPMSVLDEDDLLERLVPGVDGLVLELGLHRATFLPKVWEHLPIAADFLGHLKSKAGLPGDYWSTDIVLYRYHTETFGEAAG
jgi:AmmeMemoRadiSam system protein A